MNKRVTWAAVVVVGMVGVAAWSLAQSPKENSSAKSPSSDSNSIGPASSGPAASGPSSSGKLSSGPSAGGTKSSSALPGRTSLPSSPQPASPSATKEPAAGAKSRPTSSGDVPGLDSSLAPFRGSSTARSDALPGSSLSAGTSIRIDHALVTSLDPIKLPAREAGAIRAITVKKGLDVKVGDILGQLDDLDAQTKKKIAELERDAAKVQADSDAQIDAAEKGELVTKENYNANQELLRKSPGALSAFDMRRSLFEWQRAQAQIAVAKVEKAVAKATQLAKEGQIDGAMIEIERRKIVAPIDGFVNEVYKHTGEWCQPGDPVLEIVRMDRLEIEGFVFAADASPSKLRGKAVDVVVQVAGGDAYKASGTITFASPVLEGSGRIRQFRVSTEIDNKKVPDERGELQWLISPGSEAEMTIVVVPPTPKPVAAPKSSSPAGAKTTPSGTKVEALKPTLPDLGAKGEAKTDSKAAKKDSKTDAKSDGKIDGTKPAAKSEKPETKAGTKSESKSETRTNDKGKTGESKAESSKSDADKKPDTSKVDSPMPEKLTPAKSDESNASTGTGAANKATADKKAADKPDDAKPASDKAKDAKSSDASSTGSKTKESAPAEKSDKPAEKSGTKPTKSSKVEL